MLLKKIISLFVILLLMPVFAVFSDDKPASIETVLAEIRAELNLGSDEAINPDKVSDQKLEELGDAVMEEMIGDSERHELMDKMMGGEESASLRALHIRMGYRFLAGDRTGGWPGGMMGMRGASRFYPGGGGHMLWSGFPGTTAWIALALGAIFIAVAVIVTVVVVRLVLKGTSGLTAQDIVRQRYAKGEITKEEFERLVSDLK